ncbi:MAG: hypothetical protein RMA76_27395 [Deltaproteobacteria bacterium]|jgi:hypothetical protein
MSTAARTTDLDAIRALLKKKAPFVGERGGRPTGVPELDRLLGGGFVKGGITVLTGLPGSGRMSIAARLLAEETHRRPVAWIDAKGTLYPPALANLGVRLNRMLIVRGAKDRSVYAAEQIIASRAFGVVIAIGLDGQLDDARARRLQTVTEGTDTTTVLILEPRAAERFGNAVMKLSMTRRATSMIVQVDKDRTGAAGRRATISNAVTGFSPSRDVLDEVAPVPVPMAYAG